MACPTGILACYNACPSNYGPAFTACIAECVQDCVTTPDYKIGISQGITCSGSHAPEATVAWSTNQNQGVRTLTSNMIPPFKVNDYCPFGIGAPYCGIYKSCPSGVWGVAGELCIPEGSGIELDWGPNDVGTQRGGADWGTFAEDLSDCPRDSWLTMPCPQQDFGTTLMGDCPNPIPLNYTFPLDPLPARRMAGPKTYDGRHGAALDGIQMAGPREAGGMSLEEANIVKDACMGHPTPGHADARYHYHMSPHCADRSDNFLGEPYTEEPGNHSPLLAWEFDGFGLFGHQDRGGDGNACSVTCAGDDCFDDCGAGNTCHCGFGHWTGMDFCKTSGDTGTCENQPVTDRCNGHFGPIPGDADLSYHYHVRTTPPYTVGCFGPEWDQCEEIHGGAGSNDALHYCSEPCTNVIDGVCVQPGFEDRWNIDDVEFGPGYTGDGNGGM